MIAVITNVISIQTNNGNDSGNKRTRIVQIFIFIVVIFTRIK